MHRRRALWHNLDSAHSHHKRISPPPPPTTVTSTITHYFLPALSVHYFQPLSPSAAEPCTTWYVPLFIFFAHPIYYSRTFFLSISPSLDVTQIQGHYKQAFLPPLPTTAHAFVSIARRLQTFLSSSTRIDSRLPTLLGALSNGLTLTGTPGIVYYSNQIVV